MWSESQDRCQIFCEILTILKKFHMNSGRIGDLGKRGVCGDIWRMGKSKEIGDVHWHLFDRRVVKLLNVLKSSFVLFCDKVDGGSFTSKSTTATDTMDVVFAVRRQVIVDDQRHLLHIWVQGSVSMSHKGQVHVPIPRARRSVVINTLEDPVRNSRITWRYLKITKGSNFVWGQITCSRFFWSMSPCIQDTVKSRLLSCCVNHSTFFRVLRKITHCVIVTVSYKSHNVSN